MPYKQFKLVSDDFDTMVDFVQDLNYYHFIRRGNDMATFVQEDMHYFSSFYVTRYIVVSKQEWGVLIDVVSGSTDPILGFLGFGYFNRFIKQFKLHFDKYCEEHNLKYEEISKTRGVNHNQR